MPEKSKKPDKVVPLKKGKCPTCTKPAAAGYFPFCSKRCSDLDLGRWLDGAFRIPTNEAPSDAAMTEGEDEEY
jgi:endogenous inhibitor of DNA gyrase (YacG/DUF329 family)